jgi:2-polyprenyl-3-methyl-5-hydroxy-6-metoxy-1,4-benzoquinol methylase
MNKNNIQLEDADCSLCNSKDKKNIYTVKDYMLQHRFAFNLYQCKNCGHIFTNPRPNINSIQEFYEKSYHCYKVKTGIKKYLNNFSNFLRFKQFQPYLSSINAEVLEIGSSYGEFLNLLKGKGYSVSGIEMDQDAAKVAKEFYNIDVSSEKIEEHNFPENKYQTIIMLQVLEHLYDPNIVLAKCHKALVQDGYLIVSVPNIDCIGFKIFGKFWRDLDVPRHLHHFSPKTLQNISVNNHFEIIQVSYSSAPNDLIGSLINLLFGNKSGGHSSFFSIYNPILIILTTPFSFFFSKILKRGARMTLILKKK